MRLVAALLAAAGCALTLTGHAPLGFLGVEDIAALGVSVFFVISGYLVTESCHREPRAYLLRRLLRIAPGLIAALVLTVVVLRASSTAASPDYWMGAAAFVARNALLYPATFDLPGVALSPGAIRALGDVLWTLRLELSFYLLVLLVRGRRSLLIFLFLIFGFLWMSLQDAAPHWATDSLTRAVFLTGRCGMLFFAGAALQTMEKAVPLWLGLVSAVAFPFAGAPLLPLAVLGLSRPGRLPADLSYGVYVFAFPVQQWLAEAGRLDLLTGLLAIAPIAVASWFLIERPLQRLQPGPPPAW